MDPRDIQLIERLVPTDEDVRRLWEQHRSLEAELVRLDAQRFLTPQEQVRRKEIQKAKLAGRDRLQTILDRHR